MSTVPFHQQCLSIDPIEQIQHKITAGCAVSGAELLRAIESSRTSMDSRLRALLPKFSIAAKKRRGRPAGSKGREDFALLKLERLYAKLLPKYQLEVEQRRRQAKAAGPALPAAEAVASELAYLEALETLKQDFPNISWEALRNKHSAWKNGRCHSAENHVDSEDFDAEIDCQFPKPKTHK